MRILCLLPLFLAGCGTTEVIQTPVPVEVIVEKFVPIPADLTKTTPAKTIPDTMTYGRALTLWAEDRAVIEALNARLAEIAKLENNQ